MQGQRSTIDSAPEAFEFDHGSSTSNSGVDRQHIWTDMLNHPFESRLFLSPADAHVTFPHAASHDGRSSSGWNIGEPSSGRSSSLTTDQGAGLRLEERRFEPTNTLSLEHGNINRSNNQVASGPLSMQNTGSSDIPLNNFHVGYVGNHSSQVIEAGVSPQLYKPGESESGSSSASSNASDSSGYFTEEGDGRPGYTQDGRRLSCKRKAFEGVSAQSSSGAGPSYSQQPENSAWNDIPPRYNAGGNLTISSPREHPSGVNNSPGQLNSRLGSGMRNLASDNHPALGVEGNVESSQRNFRMRTNPSIHQDSAPSNFSLTGNAVRHPNVWPSHHLPSRFVPFNQSTDSRPTTNTSTPQIQSNAMNGPGLLRNAHLNPWNGTSDSRVGSISSSPVIPAERPSLLQEINSRRHMQMNGSDLPIFVRAEARGWVQDPAGWRLANGSISHPGDTASNSRVGSSSAVHQSPGVHTWGPHPNHPPQNQPRFPEMLIRSFVTSSGSESGGVCRNFPPSLRPGAASSHEVAFSSGAGRSGHHQPHPREAFWMDRPGAPQPFRTSFAGSDGRSRIISEIRNALDIMRRGGETFMFEDLILMDPNVINGVADFQDRHRDMRLDVDNMSYEELLALEERIGDVNTGLTEETVMKFLKQRKYASATMGAPAEFEPCCICQDEYVEAEDLGALDCGHIFHTGCIRKWLTQKNLCPVCKTTALVT